MDSTHINDTISDYLSSKKKTDYALMIAGDWGCGKTYYADNDLKKLVTEHNYKLMKVSLYGLSSYEDFYRRIFVAQVGEGLVTGVKVVKKIAGVIPRLSGLSDFTFTLDELKRIYSLKEDIVLVVDDLERMSKNIDITEVLGLINDYVEHYNRKVIVLCNEDKREEINEFKEKTVRFTLKYTPNKQEVLHAILKENFVDQEYVAFIITKQSILLDIFELGGSNNLRTLKFILDIFKKVYDLIPQNIAYRDELLNNMLISTVVTSCEYKSGMSLLPLMNIHRNARISSSGKKTTENGTETVGLENRYKGWYNVIEYSEAIADLVQYGYIQGNILYKELNDNIEFINRNMVTEETQLINKLSNPNSIQDDEILPFWDELLSYIDAGRYDLYQLMQAYALCVRYDAKHWGGFILTNEIKERFKKGIELSRDRHVPREDFAYRIPIWDTSEKEASKIYNELRDLAIKVNWDAIADLHEVKRNALISKIMSNSVKDVQSFSKNTDNMKAMRGMDWESFVKAISDCDNPTACESCDAIIRLTSDISILGPDGRDNIEYNLLPRLKEYINNNPTKIRTTFMKELYDYLKEKCER